VGLDGHRKGKVLALDPFGDPKNWLPGATEGRSFEKKRLASIGLVKVGLTKLCSAAKIDNGISGIYSNIVIAVRRLHAGLWTALGRVEPGLVFVFLSCTVWKMAEYGTWQWTGSWTSLMLLDEEMNMTGGRDDVYRLDKRCGGSLGCFFYFVAAKA